MSYIDRNLLKDERILFRTKKHLIIFTLPVIVLLISGFTYNYLASNEILRVILYVPWFITGVLWAFVGLNYWTSEFAVTNKRIMMREGFFTRHTNEIRLGAISQVNVDQNLIGQLLDFGVVSINAFGAFDYYPTINHPVKFQRCVNEEIDRVLSGRSQEPRQPTRR